MFQRLDRLETVDSTNDYLKAFIDEGRPRAVLARQQTCGKGRYGRSWHSPPGLGLYLSLLVFPRWSGDRTERFNQVATLAVLDAIRSCGGADVDLRVKPPNDIYAGRRKLCGILTELASLSNQVEWAIVGIGVNLFHEDFPEFLQERATSLRLEGVEVDPAALAEAVTQAFERIYRQVERGNAQRVEARYSQAKRLEA